MTISKKHRDLAMRIICDFFAESTNSSAKISTKYLYYKGFPKEIDAEQVIKILCSMDYISYAYRPGSKEPLIELKDKGRCYFEAAQDSKSEFLKKSIYTPIIVSFITTVLTVYLLPLILRGLKLLLELIQ